MNNLFKILALAITLVLASALPAHARLLYVTGGTIMSIDNRSLVISDLAFRLSPTVRVYSADKKPMSLRNLKAGDVIRVEVHLIGKRQTVERIDVGPPRK